MYPFLYVKVPLADERWVLLDLICYYMCEALISWVLVSRLDGSWRGAEGPFLSH